MMQTSKQLCCCSCCRIMGDSQLRPGRCAQQSDVLQSLKKTHFIGILLLLPRPACDNCLLMLLAQLLLPLTKLLRVAPVRYACTETDGARTRLMLMLGRPRHRVLPSCCCCCCKCF
jgi:hypothetical protein